MNNVLGRGLRSTDIWSAALSHIDFPTFERQLGDCGDCYLVGTEKAFRIVTGLEPLGQNERPPPILFGWSIDIENNMPELRTLVTKSFDSPRDSNDVTGKGRRPLLCLYNLQSQLLELLTWPNQCFWDDFGGAKAVFLRDPTHGIYDLGFRATPNLEDNAIDIKTTLIHPFLGEDWDGSKIWLRCTLHTAIWSAVSRAIGRARVKRTLGNTGNCVLIGTQQSLEGLAGLNETKGRVLLWWFSEDDVALPALLASPHRHAGILKQGLRPKQVNEGNKKVDLYMALKGAQVCAIPRASPFWDDDMKAKVIYLGDPRKMIYDTQFTRAPHSEMSIYNYEAPIDTSHFGQRYSAQVMVRLSMEPYQTIWSKVLGRPTALQLIEREKQNDGISFLIGNQKTIDQLAGWKNKAEDIQPLLSIFCGNYDNSGDANLTLRNFEFTPPDEEPPILAEHQAGDSDITVYTPSNNHQPYLLRREERFWDNDMKAKIVYLNGKIHDIQFKYIIDSQGSFIDYQANLDYSLSDLNRVGPRTIRFRRELHHESWDAVLGYENLLDLQRKFENGGNCFLIMKERTLRVISGLDDPGTDKHQVHVFLGWCSGSQKKNLRYVVLSQDQRTYCPQSICTYYQNREIDIFLHKPRHETQPYNLSLTEATDLFWDKERKAKIVYLKDPQKRVYDIQFQCKSSVDHSHVYSDYHAEVDSSHFGHDVDGQTAIKFRHVMKWVEKVEL